MMTIFSCLARISHAINRRSEPRRLKLLMMTGTWRWGSIRSGGRSGPEAFVTALRSAGEKRAASLFMRSCSARARRRGSAPAAAGCRYGWCGSFPSLYSRASMRLPVLLLFFCAAAHAQYPDKPLRLVVGFSAGGPTDLPARFIADRLGAALGQRVVVENRTGAGGQIATQDVLARPRDGYHLLLCTHFEAINLAIYKNAAYRLSDIAPVSQISRYYYGVVLTNEIPVPDWDGFIAYAKANPGKLNYGMVGRGSAQEILALELAKLTGIQLTGIPYKGGAEIINDLLPGRLHLYVAPTLQVLPLYKAGRLRTLAVSSAERLAAAPEIPTLREKGLPF